MVNKDNTAQHSPIVSFNHDFLGTDNQNLSDIQDFFSQRNPEKKNTSQLIRVEILE